MRFSGSALQTLPALAALLALAACGARTGLDASDGAGGAPLTPTADTTASMSSAGGCEAPPDPPPGHTCGRLSLHLAVQAACDITRLGCGAPDAEGFVSVQACVACLIDECGDGPYEPHRVFAMGRLGAGHVIGWADTTSAEWLIGNFDAYGYLGGPAPRIASIGMYPCQPNGQSEIPGATYLGAKLPAELEDAEALAADWDILVACGYSADFGPAFAPAALGFVRDHGRGLLALGDYTCPDAAPPPAMEQMNAVLEQAGFRFEANTLGYGEGDVDQACVVDYPP